MAYSCRVTDSPVILLHGLASSADHGWRSGGWFDLLADAGRTVIAVDLPGHGTARRPTDPADYPDVAAEVADQIRSLLSAGAETDGVALPWTGAVDAVGFSAGAHLLLECAVRGLLPISRLALLGVGPSLLEPGAQAVAELVAALDTDGTGDSLARLFRGMAANAGNDPAAVSAFLRRPVRELARDDLAAVSCPVLIVTGDRDPAGSAEELAALLPDARGRSLPGADHFSVQSDVRAMDAVLSFLGI
jgi:pimeloyl-ACP methyl ester carboxylesterase